MAVSFPRLPRWLCGGNTKVSEKKESSSSVNHSSKKTKSSSKLKKMKRGWIGRGGSGEEEQKMGNVMFPKPDEPEWSIGWVEPHGPGFKSQDDGGFVVLVPCYKKVIDGSGNQIPKGFFSPAPDCLVLGSDESGTADVKNLEQWMSSMGKLLTKD